jgi:hypothetical protein
MYEDVLMWKYFVEQFNGNSFILDDRILILISVRQFNLKVHLKKKILGKFTKNAKNTLRGFQKKIST